MCDKKEVYFLVYSKKKGNMIKESSIFVRANTVEDAEKRAYAFLTRDNAPFRDEIILVSGKK